MVLPLPPLVIGTLAIAILGIIARDSGAVFEWIMAFAGPVLALIASTAAGMTLTGAACTSVTCGRGTPTG